jgi:hypothetical protein
MYFLNNFVTKCVQESGYINDINDIFLNLEYLINEEFKL